MFHRSESFPNWGKTVHLAGIAFLMLVAVAVMLFAIPHASAAFKYVQKGSDVPDFTIKTLSGEDVNLAALKEGKSAIILFWATWSPRSLDEMKFLEGLYKEHKDKGLKIVGINVNHLTFSMEDMQAVQKAVADTGVTFPIALDKGLEIYNAFGVVATPSTLVMTSGGQVAYEVSSFMTFTGEQVRENAEIALGVRQAAAKEAVAEAPAGYKPVKKAMLMYNLGRNLLKMGSKEKAMDKLSQAVEEDPKYAAPRVLLGHLYLETAAQDPKSLDQAVKLFNEALSSEAGNVSALTGLAEGLMRTGKLDEAETKFNEAVAADQTYTPAVAGLATVYSKKGKYPEAIAKFKEALELNPLSPDVYSRRASSYESQGMMKESARDLRKAVEILLGYGLTNDEV